MSDRPTLRQIMQQEWGGWLETPAADIPDSAKWDDLGCDSLDQVELVMAVEEVYEIDLHDDELDGIETVGDFAALIRRKAP